MDITSIIIPLLAENYAALQEIAERAIAACKKAIEMARITIEDVDLDSIELPFDDALNKGCVPANGGKFNPRTGELTLLGGVHTFYGTERRQVLEAVIRELHAMKLAMPDHKEGGHSIDEWLDGLNKVYAIAFKDKAERDNDLAVAKIALLDAMNELEKLEHRRTELISALDVDVMRKHCDYAKLKALNIPVDMTDNPYEDWHRPEELLTALNELATLAADKHVSSCDCDDCDCDDCDDCDCDDCDCDDCDDFDE